MNAASYPGSVCNSARDLQLIVEREFQRGVRDDPDAVGAVTAPEGANALFLGDANKSVAHALVPGRLWDVRVGGLAGR